LKTFFKNVSGIVKLYLFLKRCPLYLRMEFYTSKYAKILTCSDVVLYIIYNIISTTVIIVHTVLTTDWAKAMSVAAVLITT
jgi:hypothetical protein